MRQTKIYYFRLLVLTLNIDLEKKPKNISENPEPEFDWRATLYYGDMDATIINQNNKKELV